MLVLEPTVMAAGTRAGEELQALALEFPAATAKVTLRLMAPLTAVSRALQAPPPRLMLATAGSTRFVGHPVDAGDDAGVAAGAASS